jgi:hypothetical protein
MRAQMGYVPPLEPLPVDELVRRLRRRPWEDSYVDNRGLRFPVDLEDRSFGMRSGCTRWMWQGPTAR